VSFQGLESLRRDQQKELDSIGKETLKGKRFLLLRNYDSLNPDHKERLDALMQATQPLFVMHSMKEQLRLFWEKADYNQGMSFLDTWCKDAHQSGIKQLVKVAKTLSGYRTAILNYYKHRITNAVLEGTNNRIKTLKRQPMDSGIWNTSNSTSITCILKSTHYPDEPYIKMISNN